MDEAETFEQAIELSHRALDEIVRGNPDPFFDLYSRSDDATIANPYGPPARGFPQIQEAGRRAAANYRDGRALAFEAIARQETAELAYLVEIERLRQRSRGPTRLRPLHCA